jgi:hypothetical protein
MDTEPTTVKLSDVIAALQTIGDWTAAVRDELEAYERAAGDIDLSTPVGEVGRKIVSALSTRGSGVGKSC